MSAENPLHAALVQTVEKFNAMKNNSTTAIDGSVSVYEVRKSDFIALQQAITAAEAVLKGDANGA